MITELDMTVNRSAPPMVRVLQGDCLAVLPTLEAESVQCCVTSPPFFGLRDYGTATWEGGDAGCEHVETEKPPTIGSSSTLGFPSDGGARRITEGNQYHNAYKTHYRDLCGKCGARRIDAQLGLEPTPAEYVANLVRVFREVWRVLRPSGTVFLNLGDSYCSQPAGNSDETFSAKQRSNNGSAIRRTRSTITPGLKPKDLCMIPARVALALQADGWYLRSELVWAKPNPMPESVTDRCTKSHEMIYMLTKRGTYFYDALSIQEPSNPAHFSRYKYDFSGANGRQICPNDPDGQRYRPEGKRDSHETRNKRSVWTVATAPFSGAHFATMPPDLIKPCILAGSRVGDTVLDPFAGSGTTGKVATEYGRKSVLIELNPAYVAMIRDRTNVTAGML